MISGSYGDGDCAKSIIPTNKCLFCCMIDWDFWEMRVFELLNFVECVRRMADGRQCCAQTAATINLWNAFAQPIVIHLPQQYTNIITRYRRCKIHTVQSGRSMIVYQLMQNEWDEKCAKKRLKKIYLSSDTSLIKIKRNEKGKRTCEQSRGRECALQHGNLPSIKMSQRRDMNAKFEPRR